MAELLSNPEAFELLAKIDPNFLLDSKPLLYYADSVDKVKQLLRNENFRYDLEIHKYVIYELFDESKLKLLFDAGFDIGFDMKIRSILGATLLHKATVRNYSVDLVKLLINFGLNVNAQNNEGATALHFACKNNNYEVVKLLIDNGANVNIESLVTKQISLYTTSCVKIIKLLIENKVNLDHTDCFGCTRLHYSCGGNEVQVTKLLLENNANINLKNYEGYTPAQLRQSQSEIKELLKIYERKDITVKNLNKKQYDLVKQFLDILELKHE